MHKPTTSLAFSFILIVFVFSLTLDVSLARAQTNPNQPNPNVGDPFSPPPNAVAWKVVNIDIEHEDGPFALPGKPNPNGYPVLDPASFFWSDPDACLYKHLHSTFPPLSNLVHSDPAPGPPATIFSCGHGGIIWILAENQAPVLNEIPDINIDEGADEFFEISAFDPDGDALSFGATTLPSFANLITNTTGITVTVVLMPRDNDAGVYTPTITVSDGDLSDSQMFTITINDVPPPAPEFSLTKDDGGVTVEPGDNLTYTMVLTNTGGLATNTIITDTVPANTTFDADANIIEWNCPDGAGPGTDCGYAIGDLSSGSTAQVTFVVNVNATLPADVTEITNTAIATADNAEATSNSIVTTIKREPPVQSRTIPQIQGTSHISPFVGQQVGITGTVTLAAPNGIWLQDPLGDGDPDTSDGIFVRTDAVTRTLKIGDNVTAIGIVNEFRPGGPNSSNLTITQIISANITLNSTGNPLPAPTVIGSGPNLVINTDDGTITVEDPAALYLPEVDGIDFWESLEGMRTQVFSYTVVGPTNDDGTIWGVGDGGVNAGPFTERGGIYITPSDSNPERIQFGYDFVPGGAPNLDNRSTFSQTIGVVDYNFDNYLVQVTDQTEPIIRTVVFTESTTLKPLSPNQFTVATFNFNDLNGTSPPEQFDGLAKQIVNNLGAPDIILLQGVGDDNGADDGGIVSAEQTLTLLQSTIKANGGTNYDLYSINPLNGQNSGTPGVNLRTAILTAEKFEVPGRSGGDAVTPVTVNCTADGPELNPNPGLVNPTSAAFEKTPKPIALEVILGGERFYLFNIDLISQETDDPLFGHRQPPIRHSEAQRLAQAQVVRGVVDDILACNANANVMIAGGVYDPLSSIVGTTLTGNNFASLADFLPANKRYNLIVDGNSQLADDFLVPKAYLPIIIKNTASLQALAEATSSIQAEVDIVHVNAEFAQNKRVSDRDPIVARFTIGEEPETRIVPVARDSFVRQESKDTNEGANPRLVVGKHARTVVAFDLSSVTSLPTTAALELTVVKSQNWKGKSDAVNAHRLWQLFTEGNGFVLGQTKTNVDRGTGPGTTYHCATDAEISDNNPDCAAHWKGGELGAAEDPTDSALHTNDLTPGETVRWDVTADVLQALAEGANEIRWLLQKQGEGNDGKVVYYSKEGDANFGPRLLLE